MDADDVEFAELDQGDLNGDEDSLDEMDDQADLDEQNVYGLENEESSSSSDEDDDEAEKLEIEIKKVNDAISLNPFDYDSHLKLIELCKIAGDSRPDELRSAREQMSKIYPLSPKLWLDWLSDEKDREEQNNQRILNLFERAIQDYVSVDIWVEYQQFVLKIEGENVDIIKIYEQALTSVGLHPIQGHAVWEIYRLYEKLSVEFETDKEKQLKRVFALFQRELSIPNIHLDNTYKEFQEWITGLNETYPTVKFDCSSIGNLYKKSKEEFERIRSFEERLSVEASLECYHEYLDYEIKQKNPTRVQFLFERAITDHCLVPELWIKYLKYLQDNLNFYDILIVVLQRAVRNVVWCSEIWIEYVKTIERFDKTEQEAQEIFERSLTSSFPTEEDYRKVWLSYLEFKRRKTDFSDLKQVDKLRKNFDTCIQHLNSMYSADPYFTVSIYQAKVEAKFCSNIAKSREIWEEIMTFHKNLGTKQVNYWLEYATLEKLYGDQENYKKVMLRALNYCPESFDLLSSQLIRHFKEESDNLKEIDAVEKSVLGIYEKVVKKYREKQQEEGKGVKRKENTSKSDSRSSNKKFKNEPPPKPSQPIEFKKPTSDVNNLNTIIVKNLSYDLNEEKLRETFSKFGNIKDVRLVRKFDGRSKGFCYIEYSSIEEARNAVRNDRMLIDERPAFISEMNKNPEFRFKNDLEKNKLFISKLPPKITQARLREIYGKFDGFREVRLNTYRNGHSKGNAYVEFKTDRDASRALMETDGMEIDKKKISVELSNPPKKSKDVVNERALGDALFKKPASIG